MAEIVNLKGEPMPNDVTVETRDPIEVEVQNLLDALAALKKRTNEPGFSGIGFRDAAGKAWAINAVLRVAARDFNRLLVAAGEYVPSKKDPQ